jgi:uncharacterized membrane protein YedE/YeeE
MTVLHSFAGGLLIGGAAALLVLRSGNVAGISGITASALSGTFGPQGWRAAFLLGLVVPALAIGGANPAWLTASLPLLAVSGVLVGIGTRLGSGCTSGHGVCGIANASPRSLVATLTFMATAMVTVAAVRHGWLP